MQRLSIDELRRRFMAPPPKEVLSCSLLPMGIPKGAITEITGFGKTEFIAQILKEHPTLNVAWIEEELTAYPIGFLQRGISLRRILFIEGKEHLPWACLCALKAQTFKLTITQYANFDLKTLRRFQLASEKANTPLLWLSPQPHKLWPISKHIHVDHTLFLKALDSKG